VQLIDFKYVDKKVFNNAKLQKEISTRLEMTVQLLVGSSDIYE